MFYSPDLVKSVQIRIYFWSVFSCIPTEYRKIRIRNNSVFGHFSRSDGVGRRMNLMRFKGACSSRVWENNLTKTCTFTSGSSATYTRFKGSLLTSEIKASLLKFFSFFFFCGHLFDRTRGHLGRWHYQGLWWRDQLTSSHSAWFSGNLP